MASRDKQENRRKDFKKTVDNDDARRRRSSLTDSLRKNKKEESLMKRRNLSSLQNDSTEISNPNATENVDAPSAPPSVHIGNEAEVSKMLENFHSGDIALVLVGTTQIRKLLSIETNPPIQEIIDLGVLPQLVQHLRADEHPKLQLESAWALTNIASGSSEQTNMLATSGAVPELLRMLDHPMEEIRDQCVWAIGNIAGDGPSLRDLCLEMGALGQLMKQFTDSSSLPIIRNATWAISNLCRGKPQPVFAQVVHAVPLLSKLLHYPDTDTIADAAWALSYLTDGENEKIQVVCDDPQIISRLVDLLSHEQTSVQTPSLRAIGNIVTGTEMQTQMVVDFQPMLSLRRLLESQKKALRKEACWALSNITAGSQKQIQSVIEGGVIPVLTKLLERDVPEVVKEACWAISNAASGGSPQQIRTFASSDMIKNMVYVLKQNPHHSTLVVVLECLYNVLKAGIVQSKIGSDDNIYFSSFEECDALDVIEALQEHARDDVYNKARQIIEDFWGEEDDDEYGDGFNEDAENIHPNPNASTISTFSMAQFNMSNNMASGGFSF